MQAVMPACLPQKWQRKLKSTTTDVRIQDTKRMPRLDLPRGSPLDQKQCLLFGKLSAEVRLLIYEEVLADPHRLLHFLHVTPLGGRPKKLGHWRCENPNSQSLTWQHACFGLWTEGESQYIRDASYTNGDLISLLLTCRLIYYEAIEVLYTANHLSFRGITGISSFCALVAPDSWNMLRKLHISTSFLTPMERFMVKRDSLPGENYQDWENGCRALAGLHKLYVLRIEVTIMHQFQIRNSAIEILEQEAALFVLGALKLVTAQDFVVELNLQLPDTTIQALGSVPFNILRHAKSYDWENFSL